MLTYLFITFSAFTVQFLLTWFVKSLTSIEGPVNWQDVLEVWGGREGDWVSIACDVLWWLLPPLLALGVWFRHARFV